VGILKFSVKPLLKNKVAVAGIILFAAFSVVFVLPHIWRDAGDDPIGALGQVISGVSRNSGWRVPAPLRNVSTIGRQAKSGEGVAVNVDGPRCFYINENQVPPVNGSGLSQKVTYKVDASMLLKLSGFKVTGTDESKSVVTIHSYHLLQNLGPPDWEGGCYEEMDASDFSGEVSAIDEEVVADELSVEIGAKTGIEAPPDQTLKLGSNNALSGKSVVVASHVGRFKVSSKKLDIDLGAEPHDFLGHEFKVANETSVLVSAFDSPHDALRVVIKSGSSPPGTPTHWHVESLGTINRVECAIGTENYISTTTQCVDVVDGGAAVIVVGMTHQNGKYGLNIRRTIRRPVSTPVDAQQPAAGCGHRP
jgi:hypothetical protein